MSHHLFRQIETLWNYMQMGHKVKPADCILVFCSNDTRVAEHAAKLYLQGYGKKILFSGKSGRFTDSLFEKTEAETFATIARDCGVPAKDILLEVESTNSGENVLFSAKLIREKGLQFSSYLVVQKPFMERRAYATFKKQWPDHYEEIQVTSQQTPIFEYTNEEQDLDNVILALVADFERIEDYAQKGFQISQDIPSEVQQAYGQIREKYLQLATQ
ncbi:YdcF family protein [Vibrio sonorensis]|uniref:YdcF family protein n=1 Tax=Vibrio sonorensis TaxID=1004316 RepID=UPI0008DA7D34|nr:YdcF family protein [Vibrio sonorensis]